MLSAHDLSSPLSMKITGLFYPVGISPHLVFSRREYSLVDMVYSLREKGPFGGAILLPTTNPYGIELNIHPYLCGLSVLRHCEERSNLNPY